MKSANLAPLIVVTGGVGPDGVQLLVEGRGIEPGERPARRAQDSSPMKPFGIVIHGGAWMLTGPTAGEHLRGDEKDVCTEETSRK